MRGLDRGRAATLELVRIRVASLIAAASLVAFAACREPQPSTGPAPLVATAPTSAATNASSAHDDAGAGVGDAQVAEACELDLTNDEAMATFHYVQDFGLTAEDADKLRASLRAAAALAPIAGTLDQDTLAGCAALAKDLGDARAFSTSDAACGAAVDALKRFDAKIGGRASVDLVFAPSHCAIDLGALNACVTRCESGLSAVNVVCRSGELQGRCLGGCNGTCELSAPSACNGICRGSCDAGFRGECGSACSGRCDGRAIAGGACFGLCEGRCDAFASGACSGTCDGSCESSLSACNLGMCSGYCGAWMGDATQCDATTIALPAMPPECEVACRASVASHAECWAGRVFPRVLAASDANAAATLRTALANDLPRLDQALTMHHAVRRARDLVDATTASARSAATSAKARACADAAIAALSKSRTRLVATEDLAEKVMHAL
jgi:hypothetical protein